MNEQDQKILELYLKNVRKKRIFLVIVITLFICIILFILLISNTEYINNANNESIIKEESNHILNTIEENNSQTISKTTEENTQNDIVVETQEINEIDNTNIEREIEVFSPNPPTQHIERKEENKRQKPSNKDFLFIEGYAMENVTQAAQDYLKSSGFAGECIPLKDNEGVYLGMRVIFY